MLMCNLACVYMVLARHPTQRIERIFIPLSLFSTLAFLSSTWFMTDLSQWHPVLGTGYSLYFYNLIMMHLLWSKSGGWRAAGPYLYSAAFAAIVLVRVWPTRTAGDPEPLTSFVIFAFIAASASVLVGVFGAYREQLLLERIVSTTDALTGVLNRRPAVAELERLTQTETSHAVILFDVDYFKRFNDRFGHVAGDSALTELARLSEAVVGQQGLVSRWGGEEFLVVLPRCGELKGVALAERLRTRFEHRAQAESEPITASFGVAAWNGSEPYRATLTRADEALYRAKSQGRNRVVAASSESLVLEHADTIA